MLVLAQLIDEQDGCKQWFFIDETGQYSLANLTGYGGPNAADTAMISATLVVIPYGFTVGWTFNFTLVTNEITACTVTNPAGTVTDILADLTSVIFPFIDTEPFVIISDYLDMGEDAELTSNVYNFEFTVTDGTDSYTSSTDEVIVCQTCCCARNLAADLQATDCECQDGKLDTAGNTQMFLDSAIWAMENGDVDKSYANLMYAQKLCAGGCKSC